MAKRIFVSFAVEDKQYRDLLKGQALNTASPIDYTDFSSQGAVEQLLEDAMPRAHPRLLRRDRAP